MKQKQLVCLFFVSYFPIKLLYLLYHAEVCNEFAGPISAALRLRAKQLFLKKCSSSDEPLATLRPIRLIRDLNCRPPAVEMNMLPLDQLV